MTRIVVTDHALVRYLERILLLDLETVRGSIAAACERPMTAARRAGLPAEHVVRTELADFVCKDGHVLTVVRARSSRLMTLPADERIARAQDHRRRKAGLK